MAGAACVVVAVRRGGRRRRRDAATHGACHKRTGRASSLAVRQQGAAHATAVPTAHIHNDCLLHLSLALSSQSGSHSKETERKRMNYSNPKIKPFAVRTCNGFN